MVMNANIAPATAQASPFASILEKAQNQQLSLGDLFQVAEALNSSGQQARAVEVYKVWTAFNETHPLLHVAYFNYSVTLRQQGDNAGAILALQAANRLDPLFGPAHINLGRTLEDSGLINQALQKWRTYIDLTDEVIPDRINNRLMACSIPAACSKTQVGWMMRNPSCGRRSNCSQTRRRPASTGVRFASASANGRF